MRNRIVACLATLVGAMVLGAARRAAPAARGPLLTPHDSALHALNRLTYGPRPGEVDRVAAPGALHWIHPPPSPAKIHDRRLAAREPPATIPHHDPNAL